MERKYNFFLYRQNVFPGYMSNLYDVIIRIICDTNVIVVVFYMFRVCVVRIRNEKENDYYHI